MTAIASLRGIEKTYDGSTAALGPLGLDIREGEFLSLVGPSGCGKSTLLRILAGLIPPTSGSVVWLNGRPDLGFVFQDPTLMPWATARENARLALDLASARRREADARANDALARVGLGGFENAFPRALSGGMRMRCSIARALAARPRLLLMDEPFAALDEISREALNDDLLRLWREENLTIVFVTHSAYESTFLSTRVVTLSPRPGRIVEEIRFDSPPSRNRHWRLTPEFADGVRRVGQSLRAAMGEPA